MNDQEFLEYIKYDLKRIDSDLKGFLEVYYPMLRTSWNPENESSFITGWILGSKESEYSEGYRKKYGQNWGQEFLFLVHQEIRSKKGILEKEIARYLEEKSSK